MSRCFDCGRWCMIVVVVAGAALAGLAHAAEEPEAAAAKPVLLYSLYYHAEGQTQYLPDGSFSEVLKRLGEDFEVRWNAERPGRRTLQGVSVLLIVNPGDVAWGGAKPPPHFTEREVYEIGLFVQNGGGLVFMSNQTPAHNCEKKDSNRLLDQFGMEVTHFDVGVKVFDIPDDAPLVGGLKWKYIYGSILEVREDHFAHPQVLVENDPEVPVEMGPVGPAGSTTVGPSGEVGFRGPLLATAEVGKGRAVVGTDTGWMANTAIDQADNWEIARRLYRWAAGLEDPISKTAPAE